MDLHLHLSVAFRALEHKWGKPVDLDTSVESPSHLPAVIERSTTTFSSEDFLKTIKRNRPKPYSRIEDKRRRKKNVKLNDSFTNISVARMPLNDLDKQEIEKPNIHEHINRTFDANHRMIKQNSEIIEDMNDLHKAVVMPQSTENLAITVNSLSRNPHKCLKEFKFNALLSIGKKLKKKMIQ